MLNAKLIRENPEKIKQNTAERGMDAGLVDKWLAADEQRTHALQQLEELNREKNELAKVGKGGGDIEQIRKKGQELKEKQKILQENYEAVTKAWNELILQIPNLHSTSVPKGKNDQENFVHREVGDKPKFDFEPANHVEIGERLGIIDFEAGAKVSGSQFYYLKNDAVKLEFALIQYGLDYFAKKGYELVLTPDMAKSRFYLGTGYAPRGDEAQTYEIAGEDLGLIATAEVTMAGMQADRIFEKSELPLKYAAISHCFRKEAGAYGKYSKGLYRVHQFTKLEMFIYCLPEQSEGLHQELLGIEEEIVQSLGIPYRVVEMCSGDLGSMAAKKYDLEAWMPGRKDYGEITSTSNCTDYQARNLNIRYKTAKGETDYVHMLNGTAIVMSRFPIAILENFQQADGTVKVPEALVPYFGKKIISKN